MPNRPEPRLSQAPRHTIRAVTTYERYHRHLASWVDSEVTVLLVLGPPGMGKSEGYKSALGNRPYHLFSGRLSPLKMYMAIHDHPTLPIVLDDIAALLKDDNFRDMLKGLCESGQRVIRWGTTTPKLNGRAYAVECKAPVLIVLNKMPARDPDLEAVLDRCDAIRFEPTKQEVIARMRELWPEEGWLIDLIAELPTMPSLRTLVKARQWSRSKHLNLVEELLSECGVPDDFSQLVAIMQTYPASEWRERYMAETGLTERTYRRHRYLADQLVACQKHISPEACPNVRPPTPGDPADSTAPSRASGSASQSTASEPAPPPKVSGPAASGTSTDSASPSEPDGSRAPSKADKPAGPPAASDSAATPKPKDPAAPPTAASDSASPSTASGSAPPSEASEAGSSESSEPVTRPSPPETTDPDPGPEGSTA